MADEQRYPRGLLDTSVVIDLDLVGLDENEGPEPGYSFGPASLAPMIPPNPTPMVPTGYRTRRR